MGDLCILRSSNRGPDLWVCDPGSRMEVFYVGNLDGGRSYNASSGIVA